MPGPAKPRLRPRTVLKGAGIVLVGLWLAGLISYLERVPMATGDLPDHADGIIVLTGAAGRMEEAIRLLEADRGTRLLISGVNLNVKATTLRRMTGAGAALFDCCVDLDHNALNTVGNALESARWARRHGFASVILVTSDYHMPRSRLLLARAMPNVRIIPHAVDTDVSLAYLMQEYHKYLVTLIAGDLSVSPPPPDPAEDSTP
ncbi:YdcF family protein [Yunchengibacter salinarum]|uniref:YdcF family protein n=1 Tax=Yunchengibacter salinarum TaxID=3133399 RepID=UPI0035B654EF